MTIKPGLAGVPKSRSARSATRTAVSAGAAVAALLLAVVAPTALSADAGAGESRLAFVDPIPAVPPLPCTATALDASTTCGGGGHYGTGGDRGDGTGADTPSLGDDSGGTPPAG